MPPSRLSSSFAPAAVPGLAQAAVDGPVLGFTLIIAVATGLVVACAPVFQARDPNLGAMLGEAARSATVKQTRLDGVLISAEIALALVPGRCRTDDEESVAASDLSRRFFAGTQLYDAHSSLRAALRGVRSDIKDITELLRRVEATPGVEAAGISASTYHIPVMVEGQSPTPGQQPLVAVRMVSPGYLRAMGVSLIRGRWPTVQDELDVMVVNEAFARRTVPDGDPIGKTIGGSFISGTIVGVVADFPSSQLDGSRTAELYYPYRRAPSTRSIAVAVRMSAPAVSVVRQLARRRRSHAARVRVPPAGGVTRCVHRATPVQHAAHRHVRLRRPADGGRRNVRRGRAHGDAPDARGRSAHRPGARPRDVVFMIVRQAMGYAVAGIVLGIPAALAVGRTLRGLLYGVVPHDPAMIAVAAAVLGASSLAASCVPALRAARVDPVVALRSE